MTSVTQNSTPVETIQGFLACVERKDAENMRKYIHAKGTACLIRQNEPRFMTLHESIDNLEKATEKFVETIWDEVEHRDGDYATVWTKFRITRDGQASNPLLSCHWSDTFANSVHSFINLVLAHSHVGRAHLRVGLS